MSIPFRLKRLHQLMLSIDAESDWHKAYAIESDLYDEAIRLQDTARIQAELLQRIEDCRRRNLFDYLIRAVIHWDLRRAEAWDRRFRRRNRSGW